MPIHQTKLMMSKPQATGMLMPQMPMPLNDQVGHRHEEQHQQRERDGEADEPAERRLARQDDGADLVGDGAEGVARADDRARSDASAQRCAHASPSRSPSCRDSGLRSRGQVGRARPRVQLAQQRVVARVGLQLGDAAVRVVDVAEDDRLRRDRPAGRR